MMNAERREKARYRPKKMTFIAIKPEFVKLGKILDISEGGLCFQYLVKDDQSADTPALEADIFMSENGYYLPDVPCKMVWDTPIQQDMTFPTGFQSRRCGLQFTRLTKAQKGKLEQFLQECTAGAA
jgi:hypothetical protein